MYLTCFKIRCLQFLEPQADPTTFKGQKSATAWDLTVMSGFTPSVIAILVYVNKTETPKVLVAPLEQVSRKDRFCLK